MLNCAPCHGLDRKGNVAGGLPPLIDIEKRKTRAEIALLTTPGAGRTPEFDRLSEADRDGIIDYITGGHEKLSASRDEGGATHPADDKSPPYAFGGFRRWLDAEGYPAIKPPWGTLNAVDLNTGEIKWKVPLGEYKELKNRVATPTGTENYGGPVVTAGGLIFIGATEDETIRAFDKDTGAVLWQAALPFGGNATPSIYSVGNRQYVLISEGGGKGGRPTGGQLVAFALPKPTGAQ
jgi:quinoprotein glucose dehydrogenase